MITLEFSGEGAEQAALRLSSLRAFLTRALAAVSLAGDVSVLLVSDAEMRRLNRQFRGKNQPTDVLSFSAASLPHDHAQPPLGDLAISLDTARRQAQEHGHTLEVELKVLLLHGLLHLAGYDHEADAGEMAEREDALRRRFRLPASLIARAQSPRSHTSRQGGRR